MQTVIDLCISCKDDDDDDDELHNKRQMPVDHITTKFESLRFIVLPQTFRNNLFREKNM